MAEYNRKNVIEAIKDHAKGHIKKHSMNVEIYLKNAAGIGEHPDVLEAIEKEYTGKVDYEKFKKIIEKNL